jgi:adenine phosphoribosyltransferase
MPLHALPSAAARSRAARTLMLCISLPPHPLSPHSHVRLAECRGFCFAAPVAIALKVPFIPLRKPGKLPSKSIGVDFKQSAGKGAAYFGKDRLEMHEDGLKPGSRVLVIDDMLGTGSTMYGACELVLFPRGGGGGGLYLQCVFSVLLSICSCIIYLCI